MVDMKVFLTDEMIDLKAEEKVVIFLLLLMLLDGEKEGMIMILSTEEAEILETYRNEEEMNGKARVAEIVILIGLAATHLMTEVEILNVLIHGKGVPLIESKINSKLLPQWAIPSGHL